MICERFVFDKKYFKGSMRIAVILANENQMKTPTVLLM